MSDDVRARLKLPRGIPIARHRPDPLVELPADGRVPFIDKKDDEKKVIQQHWIAKIRVFDMSDPNDAEECERVWQGVCDGRYQMCENKTEFVESRGTFVQLLRYAELHHKLPEHQG